MQNGEWPRSRFWLCHFLHNRHERAPIHWGLVQATDTAREDNHQQRSISPRLTFPIANWLAWSTQTHMHSRQQLIKWAVEQCPEDPAYIQSLRLFVREEEHHAEIINRWLKLNNLQGQPAGGKRAVARRLVSPLGLRFELSLLLLTEIASRCMNLFITDQINDATLKGVLAQISHDQRCHVTFHSERLTTEFADFNFVRRNLRRLRMRGMTGSLLAGIAVRHRPILEALNISTTKYISTCWQQFNQVLENMVPYRREQLMAILMQHRDNPYDQPAGTLV